MVALNPILPFVARQGAMILDGGLATELEARGCDLNDPLWSARLLIEDPGIITSVHHDFLVAGADCIATVSYQASFPGFERRGIDHARAEELFDLSARLAVDARNAFWSLNNSTPDRLKPIVAGSIGPYGAAQADGSEYTGRYDLDEHGLFDFHRERWHLLADTDVDLLACETIPSIHEARAIRRLLDETPKRWTWVSFSCRDAEHLNDGTPIAEAAAILKNASNVAAIGINCTAPRHIGRLIFILGGMQPHPVIVYPNAGETYDAVAKGWNAGDECIDLPTLARDWTRQGASGVGGCCRVTSDDIAALRGAVIGTNRPA